MPAKRPLRDEDLDAVIGAVLRATQAFVGLALRSLAVAKGKSRTTSSQRARDHMISAALGRSGTG